MSGMVTPIGDGVFLKRVERDTPEDVKGGVIIPPAHVEAINEAHALTIGPDVVQVKAGDKVLLPQFGGTTVKLNGKEFLLISEKLLLGIM